MNQSRASRRSDGNARTHRRGKSYEDAGVFVQISLTWVAQVNNMA